MAFTIEVSGIMLRKEAYASLLVVMVATNEKTTIQTTAITPKHENTY